MSPKGSFTAGSCRLKPTRKSRASLNAGVLRLCADCFNSETYAKLHDMRHLRSSKTPIPTTQAEPSACSFSNLRHKPTQNLRENETCASSRDGVGNRKSNIIRDPKKRTRMKSERRDIKGSESNKDHKAAYGL